MFPGDWRQLIDELNLVDIFTFKEYTLDISKSYSNGNIHKKSVFYTCKMYIDSCIEG